MVPTDSNNPSPAGTSPADETGQGTIQTDWSMIFDAAIVVDGEPSQLAWDRLARRYWPAIYAFIRRSGRGVDEAADLTQGFVCDVMLGRRMVEAANPERGRFRTLLLTALKNYLAEQHRYATRQRRAPSDGRAVVELDRDGEIVARSGDRSPEDAFIAQWSASLVHRVVNMVRRECEDEELGVHWAVFELRVVRPMMFGDKPVSYSALVDRFDLKDASQAANMMITVKRRFARTLYEEVGGTVAGDDEVQEELHDLLRSLEQNR